MERDTRDAYRWASRALGRRMRSVREIESALDQRGYSFDVIAHVTGDLADKGYLDDLKFASDWVRSRSVNRGYGRIRLSHELRGKGVAEEIARKVLDQYLSTAGEMEIARSTLRKKLRGLRDGKKGKPALHRFLRGRGFTSEAIWGALGELD